MIRALLAMAALAAASPALADAPSPAGLYAISQMEMGGGLELRPDGTFRYQLDYGAVSESAEGKWSVADGVVRLTSDPMPRPPRFVMVADDPAPRGELYVSLEDPGFGWGSPFRVAVTFADMDRPQERYADENDKVDLDHAGPALSVAPIMPVYDALYEPYPLSPQTGHRVRFRFEPNDIGQAAFDREPLVREGEALVLMRYDARIVFRPARGEPDPDLYIEK